MFEKASSYAKFAKYLEHPMQADKDKRIADVFEDLYSDIQTSLTRDIDIVKKVADAAEKSINNLSSSKSTWDACL